MTRNPLHTLLPFALAMIAGPFASAQSGYSAQDYPEKKHFDVKQNGKLLGRFIYEYDNSSTERHHDTFKTFLQLYDPTGEIAISKPAGGDFGHHRGFALGWQKISVDGGKPFDNWDSGAPQLHQEFLDVKAERRGASFTSRTLWMNGRKGTPAIEELRTMTFRPAPDPAYGMLDFTSKLSALDGKTAELNGDPEHAGLQFRAAQEIDRSQTMYLYPVKDAHPHQDLDYPWLACSFAIDGKTYSVVYLNHPDNPKGTKFSAYRDYARFGGFFKATIEKDQAVVIKARLILLESKLPTAEWVQEQSNAYTGLKLPTPEFTEKGPS